METRNRLLVIVDQGDERHTALERARWLAGRLDAPVDLRIYHQDVLAMAVEQMRREKLEYLESLAAPLRAEGITVTTDAVAGSPVGEHILADILDLMPRLVLKGADHHVPMSRTFFSETDWQLIRTCPCPLLMVHREHAVTTSPVVVAAVDPLHEHEKPAALDDQIINVAKRLANAAGGEVHTFHSYDPIIAVADAANSTFVPVTLPVEELEAKMHERHRQQFNELLEFHGLSQKQAHLLAGRTQEVLPALARDIDASVVIMGAVARNRLKRIFIGSTAEQVMDNLPCDLLVLKPAWFETPIHVNRERSAA